MSYVILVSTDVTGLMAKVFPTQPFRSTSGSHYRVFRCLSSLILTLSYTGGGGGHKVPALILKVCIVATNTATATKFGEFSYNLSEKTMVC